LLAVLPYAVPALDSVRMYGCSVVPHHLAALAPLGWELPAGSLDAWELAAPVLFFMMPVISIRRRLPLLLRFNLNQAYVFQLLNFIAFALSWSVVWLQNCLAGEEAVYVPEAAQPTLLPGAELVLMANALCVAYSLGATLLGVVPEHIPVISGEAGRSTGHNMQTK
jgi:hypothetical protein